MRRAVSVAAACGVLGIGIAAATADYGRGERGPAAGDRRAALFTVVADNAPPVIMRTSTPGALASVLGLSEGAVLPFTRPPAISTGDAELPPRGTDAGGAPSKPAPAAASLPLVLLRPSGGVVTSRFGWRIHPLFGRPEFHTGLDIATQYGSPVTAARNGFVRFVGWESGYGRIIVLDHGAGMETRYSHLSAALVSPGQAVERGQVIGRIGSTGWSTGPHLFFEVRRNGVPVDPAGYLN
ncbi:MAG TPA: M23 family metallopeptidase [bacterium]|nr:M23 family metallopeptidase [bacterium]